MLIGAVLLGLVPLVLALRRGRRGALPLPSRVESVRTTASRKGIERTLRRPQPAPTACATRGCGHAVAR